MLWFAHEKAIQDDQFFFTENRLSDKILLNFRPLLPTIDLPLCKTTIEAFSLLSFSMFYVVGDVIAIGFYIKKIFIFLIYLSRV